MTSFLPVWCYQRDASCNIALVVFADGRCGVYHNDPNVKIKTVQHSPDWSLLYLLAEADPLFNSDWLHRGEPRSLSPEYLRHESLSFGSPPAGPPFTDAKTTEINLTASWPRKHGQRLRAEEGLLTVWGETERRFQKVSLPLLNIKNTQLTWASLDPVNPEPQSEEETGPPTCEVNQTEQHAWPLLAGSRQCETPLSMMAARSVKSTSD